MAGGPAESSKQNLHGMRETGPGLPNLGQMQSKGQGRALEGDVAGAIGAGLKTRRKPNEMRHGVGPKWGPMFGQGHCQALAKEASNALQKKGPGWRPAEGQKKHMKCGLCLAEVGANARPGAGPQESGQTGSTEPPTYAEVGYQLVALTLIAQSCSWAGLVAAVNRGGMMTRGGAWVCEVVAVVVGKG